MAAAIARTATARTWPADEATERFVARGKFFYRGVAKFFLRSVTYGPFAPGPDGTQFPRAALVQRDFALMRDLGANAIRTSPVPPQWLLDLALEYGIAVVVGLPWTEHVCFLEDRAVVRQIRASVRESVERCQRHPSIFAYLVGNEIPPDVVRWLGPARVKQFVEGLAALVKEGDPEPLVSYANFPPNEYLDFDQLDFVCFNVYLHREPDFRRYLLRLQSLAGDKPLVLTEFGVDSLREGREARAATAGPPSPPGRRARRSSSAPPARRSSPGPTTGSRVASRSRTGRSVWSIASATASRPSKRCSASTAPSCRSRRRRRRRCRSSSVPTTPSVRCAPAWSRCARCAIRITKSSSSTTAPPTAHWRSPSSFPKRASSRRRTKD